MLVVIYGVLFARAMGAEDYGRYGLLISVVTIATLPIVSGLPNLIIKETANYYSTKRYGYVDGLNRWSLGLTAICTLFVAMVALILFCLGYFNSIVFGVILSGLLIVPFKGYLTIQSAFINGIGKPELAQLPLHLFPAILINLIAWTYIYYNRTLTSDIAVYITLSSLLISVILAEIIKRKSFIETTGNYAMESKKWIAMLGPFSLVSVVGTLNNEVATIFLGIFDSPSHVAQFKVSNQAMYFVVMVLASINAVIAPKIASTFSRGSMLELQGIVTSSVRISSIIGVFIIVFLILFRVIIIDVLFGSEYDEAKIIIPILCIGQLVNVVMGSVNLILNMTGNERRAIRIIIFSLFINVFLMCALIPLYSAIGAAVAATISMVFWNILMARDIYKKIRIKTWLR